MPRLLFLITMMLCKQAIYGNDSTLLDRRIVKVRAFASELVKAEPYQLRSLDDTALLYKAFGNVLSKFFPKAAMKSEYNIRHSSIGFHRISQMLGVDSLILKVPSPEEDTLVDVRPLKNYLGNTIILYLPMHGGLWEGFYFRFKEGSDQLLFFLQAGGDPAEYRRKKQFLDKLPHGTDR